MEDFIKWDKLGTGDEDFDRRVKKALTPPYPCPFCGSKSIFKLRHSITGEHLGACNSCLATGPRKRWQSEAVDAWNTRAEQREKGENERKTAEQLVKDVVVHMETEKLLKR